MPLLSVRDIRKHFALPAPLLSRRTPRVHAVDGLSFEIERGETLGLVGESGCGKSTVGRVVTRLLNPTSGEIWFEGREVSRVEGERLRALRKDMQIIFQDPYASLNPRMNVLSTVGEPLVVHRMLSSRRERRERVVELLETVGLAADHLERYAHEFSGGQRQRIGIARALAVSPKLIVCDEPVSALDVSVQAQVVNLLQDLQERLGIAYLFVAHDLAVVEHIASRVAVMYLGRIVEIGPVRDVFGSPVHPYTEALMSAVPVPDPGVARARIVLKGDVPSPVQPPSGCHFHTRCPARVAACARIEQRLSEVSPGHWAACHVRTGSFAQGPDANGQSGSGQELPTFNDQEEGVA